MPDLVNLVRPDGSILQVEREKAAPLVAGGYREEGLDERTARLRSQAQAEWYDTAYHKFGAAAEGALSGVTLGLSDKVLEGLSDEGIIRDTFRKRAEYNPGYRLGGEITGQIAPLLLTGGTGAAVKGGVAAATPAVALTNLATKAGSLVKPGVARGAVVGAVEGAGFGLGSEIARSALSGDPLTVEGSMAGLGWGAVWGGSIGGVVGGLTQRGVAKREAIEAAIKKEEAGVALTAERFGQVRASINEATRLADDAIKVAEKQLKASEDVLRGSRAKGASFVTKQQEEAQRVVAEASEIRSTYFNEISANGMDKWAKAEKLAAIDAFKDMKAALKAKDWKALEKASDSFTRRTQAINDKFKEAGYLDPYMGGQSRVKPAPSPSRFVAAGDQLDMAPAMNQGAQEALDQLKELGVASTLLKGFAETPDGFSRIAPAKFEKMMAGLDTFLKQPAAELAGVQEALKRSIGDLAAHTGVTVEGNAVNQLRGVWETVRAQRKAKTATEIEKVISGKGPLGNLLATGGGVAASKMTGGSWLAYSAGRAVMNAVLGVKGAVLGTISGTAKKWGPGVLKAGRVMSSKIEPLATRLDGTVDKETKDRRELMARRAEEFRNAAGTLRDTMYRAVAPIATHHSEYAVEMHKLGVKQFIFMLDKVPRDPGNAFNKLKSLWKPDPIAAEKFARYYRTFQDPVGVMADALNTLNITPEAAEGLREMWPALFTHLRVEMLERISDPKVLEDLSYNEQVRLGVLLDLPIHSTMTPQFISSQQEMYVQRNQPLTLAPQPGMGTSGGRPSGEGSPYSTQAQRSTNR